MLLSSSWTFFTKFIELPLTLLFLGLRACNDILFPILNGGSVSSSYGFFGTLVLLVIIIGVLVEALRFHVNIKKVMIDDNIMTVSNYINNIDVPLKNIDDVRWSWAHNVITITFHDDTGFGRHIMFMPKLRFFFRIHHPTVDDIRKAVAIANE